MLKCLGEPSAGQLNKHMRSLAKEGIPKDLCSPGDPQVTNDNRLKCELGVPPFVLLSPQAAYVFVVGDSEVQVQFLQKGSRK